MAVLVSKLGHCLWDILARRQSGEWNVEIPLVISNHPDMEGVATQFGCEYHVLPITKENKKEQEAKQMELQGNTDSPRFVELESIIPIQEKLAKAVNGRLR